MTEYHQETPNFTVHNILKLPGGSPYIQQQSEQQATYSDRWAQDHVTMSVGINNMHPQNRHPESAPLGPHDTAAMRTHETMMSASATVTSSLSPKDDSNSVVNKQQPFVPDHTADYKMPYAAMTQALAQGPNPQHNPHDALSHAHQLAESAANDRQKWGNGAPPPPPPLPNDRANWNPAFSSCLYKRPEYPEECPPPPPPCSSAAPPPSQPPPAPTPASLAEPSKDASSQQQDMISDSSVTSTWTSQNQTAPPEQRGKENLGV